MKNAATPKLKCAVYTRKSTEEGLTKDFNSLDAQREACEAYIVSQKALGWLPVGDRYEDGGYSGGNLERPALKRLLADIELRKVDVVLVYKLDRISRSLISKLEDRKCSRHINAADQVDHKTSLTRAALEIFSFCYRFHFVSLAGQLRRRAFCCS